MSLLLKAVISGVLIAGISEISRRNSDLASVLAALPFISCWPSCGCTTTRTT